MSNVAGGPTPVASVRAPLRSASSASATAPVRPSTRVTPIVPAVAPLSLVQIDPAREREMNLLRARRLEQEVSYISFKIGALASGSDLLCVT